MGDALVPETGESSATGRESYALRNGEVACHSRESGNPDFGFRRRAVLIEDFFAPKLGSHE